jgi:hypothetical protein
MELETMIETEIELCRRLHAKYAIRVADEHEAIFHPRGPRGGRTSKPRGKLRDEMIAVMDGHADERDRWQQRLSAALEAAAATLPRGDWE